MKVGVAFSTKNRVELTRQSIEPLLQPKLFDLWWIDGSTEPEAERLPYSYPAYIHAHSNVRGGPDAAIVYGLTTLLQAEQEYDVVALVENDVLLNPDFFGPMMALFERGRAEGLEVGAVSARAYEDRILCQRDGFALMHNLGAGCIFLTRQAAELVLRYFRTAHTTENRAVFCQLAGIDIGRYWAFRTSEHWLCGDWSFDKVLAAHGLASLALTPSPCEMIGQVPPLAEQGLVLVTKPVELLRNDVAFETFAQCTAAIRAGHTRLPACWYCRPQSPEGTELILPHHVPAAGGSYMFEWKLRWSQGFGPFCWEAREPSATLDIPIYGSASFLVTGGKQGGKFKVVDTQSGYEVAPDLPPESSDGQLMRLAVPGGIAYRTVRLIALSPGVCFYGVQTRDPQACLPGVRFDHSVLPSV